MVKKPQKGHGGQVLDLMSTYDLFEVDTLFKSKSERKIWCGRYRYCNVTTVTCMSKDDENKRPTKLDYMCVSNRWKSMIISTKVKQMGGHYSPLR